MSDCVACECACSQAAERTHASRSHDTDLVSRLAQQARTVLRHVRARLTLHLTQSETRDLARRREGRNDCGPHNQRLNAWVGRLQNGHRR
jgi:hypothetical protein